MWPVGQAVKTPASHAGNGGSIPPRVTIIATRKRAKKWFDEQSSSVLLAQNTPFFAAGASEGDQRPFLTSWVQRELIFIYRVGVDDA